MIRVALALRPLALRPLALRLLTLRLLTLRLLTLRLLTLRPLALRPLALRLLTLRLLTLRLLTLRLLTLRLLTLRPLVLCLLAPCLLGPCVLGPCTALASGPNRVFGYERDGKMRLCRGNTTTGVADCVDGTPESASQKDGKKPMWAGVRDATIRWLRYPNPHVGAVSAQGLYEFLVIYDKRQPWVCTGDTRTGLLVCAAGTATSGQSRAISPPEFTTDPKRVITLTRWFWLEPQGTVGDYSFGSYKGVNGALRVCRMRTDSGDTTCADSTPLSSSETVRQRPRWTLRTLTSRFYRFFRASVHR